MVKLLYRNREKTIHDERILKILNNTFEILEIYDSEVGSILENINGEIVCLLGPLTDYWFQSTNQTNKNKIIGISWGYDLLSEINDLEKVELIKKNIANCAAIVVDSNHSKKVLRLKYGFKGRILTIPYGCDVDFFSSLKNENSMKNNLAILRNWGEVHNNEFVLNSLKEVKKELLGKVNLAGKGENKSKIIEKFVENNPLINVEIYDSDLLSYSRAIKNSNIYITASKVDGTSVTLLEAMASSMICVVPDTPSNREWVIDEVNGYTFKPEDREDLSETINKVLQLEMDKRILIGSNASAKIRENGDWSRNKHKLLEFVSGCAKE